MMALINNWDLKDSNNVIVQTRANGRNEHAGIGLQTAVTAFNIKEFFRADVRASTRQHIGRAR